MYHTIPFVSLTMARLAVVFALVALSTVVLGGTLQGLDHEAISEWEGRIVGGSTAGSGQFPHQASLQSSANQHFCGASVINSRWVLTAAHCTVGRSPSNTRVRVGTNSRTSGGVIHSVAAIRNHQMYNSYTMANDVATVQITGQFTFNNLVRVIPLASVNHGVVAAQISGWGQTSHPGSAPNALMWKNTQTLTNQDCKSRHTAGNANSVHDSSICTFTRFGQGTCMGDSGGPLISGGQQIGIVSWGIPCGQGRPDVYTRVFSHRNWILQNSP